jgi:phage tail tape-measure protein
MATTSNFSKPREEANKGGFQEAVTDKGTQAVDKAKEVASNVANKAKDMASTVGHKAEDATHAVGSGMQSLAGTMRDKLPQSGVLGSTGSTIASGLDSAGQYLKEEGLSGIAEDMTNLIRRNPLPALLCGVALGFVIARATSRS